ncbi:MAG: hypothetical protein AAFY88_21870 [Acidobacteriota bacterium]
MDHLGDCMDQRRGFWNLLLASSAVAAIVSLFTTAAGLSKYLSVVLAWPLAVAVQGGLFGLAWLLAAGTRRERPLLLLLYLMSMPFSVVFSYAMLQSDLTARVRPAESQRDLLDELRRRHAVIAQALDRGRSQASQLGVRLDGWLDAERQNGWATSTCDGVHQCYLEDVCGRLGDRIAAWERDQGRSYRQGPGQALVYGLIETEHTAVQELERTITDTIDGWRRAPSLAPGLSNLDRLQRFDTALAALPRAELESLHCGAVELPESPDYAAFSRDVADPRERPLYAFEDLLLALEPGREVQRSDYLTLFSAALALFIDLFVLLVAIGASRLAQVPIASEDPRAHRIPAA